MSTSKAQTGYETRLNRVIDHIYDHLEDDIRLDDLAEIACLSPYHWHRIYAAMRGETITATIRRLRLSRAAERLANSDMALEMIAERAGYGSADAFGRAFKQVYDKSPADYRMTGSHAAFKAALLAEDGAGFPIFIEALAPIRCASIAHSGAYLQIDHAMGKLFTTLAAQARGPIAGCLVCSFRSPAMSRTMRRCLKPTLTARNRSRPLNSLPTSICR